ncbi:MAG: chemotaxis protein CheA [Herbinix sp.]|jgi:two-component system chemotaxis sensor kinase CheA|nr:chemotaxis protein CheA [Herbinix sp.]
MSGLSGNEQMLEMYLFETNHNIEQLEAYILEMEKTGICSEDSINEIFRNMHTIKGSSAMMLFNNIAELAHAMEDLFYFIREKNPQTIDIKVLSDILLEGVDFIKIELEKIRSQDSEEGNCEPLMNAIKDFLGTLRTNYSTDIITEIKPISEAKLQYYIIPDKPLAVASTHYYRVVLFFEDGCEMENIRAYTVIHNLKQFTDSINYVPSDIIERPETISIIREKGFTIYMKINKSYQEMEEFFQKTIFLERLELVELNDDSEYTEIEAPQPAVIPDSEIRVPELKSKIDTKLKEKETYSSSTAQSIISVNVSKLDKLMDLVGEIVISEALVTQNPELEGLELDDFYKAARQLHKNMTELQDIVMSIRMVPLANSLHKLHRIVRDMNKNLNKEAELILIGEDTEVDKNIIEHISDPLMHLVRNSIDHGIEATEAREAVGKPRTGKIIIEAKNSGSDVLIIIKDDGRGFNKQRIIEKALERDLLPKPQGEMTDREIYNLIFLPGFSTKDNVSEYSGRGVGMDVVTKNLETIGGSILVESKEGMGSVITLKIPLTLAIIDGMNVRVGNSRYTIPTMSIKESFRPEESDIIVDPDGNEMIMVRGNCYPILRLHKLYQVKTDICNFTEGILIMIEQEDKTLCVFADELLGQQQVVVKTLPDFIKKIRKIHGISGCTMLGDGSISLIINVADLIM